MRIAITRPVGAAIAACELSHLPRVPIDLVRARAQHAEYERLLGELGCAVHRLPDRPELPDAVFVEDTAIVVDEIAIVTRPGAPSRRPETADIARELVKFRPVHSVEAPATIDGGDVLRVDRMLFVGRSDRTNDAGVAQIRQLLEPFGYRIEAVPVGRCLHLKSAVTQVGPATLVVNPDWIDTRAFAGLELLPVDPAEPSAANALLVGDIVVHASAHPRTRARLEAHGVTVRSLDVSELAKAEGALTCCSVIFDGGDPRPER